jgi:hypothetical protein
MIAKMKCSNCDAEMTDLKLSWGKKQLLLIIPIMVLGFAPLIMMTVFKGDASKDLVVSEVKTRTAGSSLEIVGLITNLSRRTWSGVSVEAEFFDSSGEFIDEAGQYLRSNINGHSEEHFKITIKSPPQEAASGEIKPVVKISGGHTSPF